MTHGDVIIFEKNKIEEKPKKWYLKKEFWKTINFRQRYDYWKVYLPSLRSASVLTLTDRNQFEITALASDDGESGTKTANAFHFQSASPRNAGE